MELVQQLLSEKGGEIIQNLTGRLGFSAEQAERFVPAALKSVLGLLQGGKLDAGALLGGSGEADVLAKIDTEGLAREAGVAAAQVPGGLQSLLPTLVSALQDKGGAAAVLSLLGGEGSGGILGAAGKIAGRFFNK